MYVTKIFNIHSIMKIRKHRKQNLLLDCFPTASAERAPSAFFYSSGHNSKLSINYQYKHSVYPTSYHYKHDTLGICSVTVWVSKPGS